MIRIVVLGGSSPFTAGLIDAIATADPPVPAGELVLQGRHAHDLAMIATYASSQLTRHGWTVDFHVDLRCALESAAVVIHQVRYGGTDGRMADEALATAFGCPADETLGPGALRSLLAALPALNHVGATLATIAPDAWVINVTNPLSATTSVLHRAGVVRCIGVCELPEATARRAAHACGRQLADLEWRYVGLNHRGFVVRLGNADIDCITELTEQLRGGEFENVSTSIVAELHAIPTKYFRLLNRGERPHVGRAAHVASVRETIRAELRANPLVSPPSLRAREMPWYAESVIPVLTALIGDVTVDQMVNVVDPDGCVTREVHARVSGGCVAPIAPTPAPPTVASYLERYERHELAVLAMIDHPSLSTVNEALRRDPTVDRADAAALARAIWSARENKSAATLPG